MKLLVALGILAALLALALAPSLLDRESLDRPTLVDEWAKAGQAHQFATLADGVTHYELSGPVDGPSVILVHGVSGPMGVWDATVPALVANGFRVLRLDLYGRGLSDRPVASAYDLETYRHQVELLAVGVGLRWPAHLVGSSMGALVAAEFARHAPDKVRAVTLIGPAGFPLQASPLAQLMNVPVIGDYLMRVAGDRALADHDRRYFFRPGDFTAFQARFERQLQVKGSKAAILATFRHVPLQSYLEGYAALGALGKPVQIIWGKEDQAFPYTHHRELLQRLAPATHPELVTIEAAGHLPQVEQVARTNAALLDFAAAHAGAAAAAR
jgi:pimeloyl-ACP methyl ester carboxylesterase